jgi:ATP citrate (pro-S)-lyase
MMRFFFPILIRTLICPVQAMTEKAEAIKSANMKIFVRRGGPNYQAGLALMRSLGEKIGVEIDVYGPDSSMTGICQLAADYVRSFD